MRRTVIIGVVAVACVTGRAEAQTPNRLSVGVTAGTIMGVATDDSDQKRVFAGSMRYDVRRLLAIEGEVAHWGQERTSQFGPHPIVIVEPNGTETRGQLESSTTRETHSTWVTSVNLLAHSNGRVAIFGGGGLGLSATRRDYSVSFTGCSAPSKPEVCNPYSIPRSNSGVVLQGIGGVDVNMTKRFGGFASVRASSGYLYQPAIIGAAAGVRIRIR